jgi:serine/threonine-protein kinase
MEKLRDKAADPLIGITLPGGHVVMELIDVGGMGRVYRAEQKMLGRTVAVKIIHPHLLGDATVEARFITEARAASQLNHPNSVGVIDFGKFDGRLYMVMEYLRGRDLATVAHEDGPLDVDRISDILVQTLAALEEAHHIGIIHRDLKPENIVLSPLRSGGDFVKVLDFGLAKVLEAAAFSANRRITDPGMVCGTPEYMAPEQARGDNVDHRVDLYACGVLLYELLAGQLPFDADSPREIVLMHLSKMPPDLRSVAPDREIPDDLIDVVEIAMAKDPRERFQSAREFSDALKEAMAGDNSVIRRALTSSEPLRECTSCGAMMPRAQKFCGECGTQLGATKTKSAETPAPPPAAETIGLPLPFTGRKEELSWLFEARDALKSTLNCITIFGPAGVGKTRLVHEFTSRIGERGDLVIGVGPDPWWVGLGYHALRDAIVKLADLPGDGGEPGRWNGINQEAKAGMGVVFGAVEKVRETPRRSWTVMAPDRVRSAGSNRELAAEALRWAFSRAQARAGKGNVILTIDDLHALDGASRNAFADLLAEPPLGPGLLIATHHAGFDPEWRDVQPLALKGLPRDVAAALLESDMAELPSDDDPAAPGRILPMYLEQLVRYAREGGEDPPPRLVDLLALRIDRFDADTRRVLQAISVVGDHARPSQLVDLLTDVSDLGHYMTILRQAGFVTVKGPVAGCGHPLIRDIVLSSTPRAVKNELHDRARNSVSDRDELPLEAQALHAYHGASSFEALMLLEESAERARDRDDPEGAVNAFHMALDIARREMMRGEFDAPEDAVMMFSCKLGDALVEAGKHHDAEGVLVEALGLAGPQSKERPRILASLANVARSTGRPADAYAHLEEALSIAERAKQMDLVDSLEEMRTRWVAGL